MIFGRVSFPFFHLIFLSELICHTLSGYSIKLSFLPLNCKNCSPSCEPVIARRVTIQYTARVLYICEILCLSSWLRSVHCYSAALFSRGVCRLGFASGCTTPCVRTAAYSCIASSLRRMLIAQMYFALSIPRNRPMAEF